MNTPCPFSASALQFQGTPLEQAQCLLRFVKVAGNVDNPSAQLPPALATRVGKPVEVSAAQVKAYLAAHSINANEIGGSLDKGVAKTSNGHQALYFVIHDTSDELSTNSFPPNINDTWSGNDLAHRTTDSAHIFINRLGKSVTGHDYSVPFRATKRERDGALKGLFLHHELIQPRIKGTFHFAAVGPQPGYTKAQLDRLALCYVAASVRRGSWMIPAFHCVLDLGIPDGHDDPQNFDLAQWGTAIETLLHDVAVPPQPPTG